MLINQKTNNFFRAMNAYDQCFFNIGRAAGTGGKGYQRGKVARVLFFQDLHPFLQFIHQLVYIGDANMHRCINTYCSAAFLR